MATSSDTTEGSRLEPDTTITENITGTNNTSDKHDDNGGGGALPRDTTQPGAVELPHTDPLPPTTHTTTTQAHSTITSAPVTSISGSVSAIPISTSLTSIAESEDSVDGATGAPPTDPQYAALQAAVCSMDVAKVEDILKHDTTPRGLCTKRAGYRHRSLLHDLVQGYGSGDLIERSRVRFIEILTILLNNGLDVNVKDTKQHTALHLLVGIKWCSEIIPVLASRGMDMDSTDHIQQTALHRAAQLGSASDVTALLQAGASVNVSDCMGRNPLQVAAKRSYSVQVMSALIEGGADPDMQGRDPRLPRCSPALHAAIRYADYENVRFLLQHNANVYSTDSAGQLAVHIAAAHDLTGKILPLLYHHGANLNAQDLVLMETPLHKAVKHHMIDNFHYLTRMSVNTTLRDMMGETVMHKAVTLTDPLQWKTLVELNGTDMTKNCHGMSPLDKATRAKNTIAIAAISQACPADLQKRHSSYF